MQLVFQEGFLIACYRATPQAPRVVSHKISNLRVLFSLGEKLRNGSHLTLVLATVEPCVCPSHSPQIPSQAGSHQQREALIQLQ